MLLWLRDNISTIIIGVMIFAALAIACGSMIRNKRKGKSSCGCGCSDCALSGACHSKK